MKPCRKITCLFVSIILSAISLAQSDSILHRLIMIGDAGEATLQQQTALKLIPSLFDLNDGHSSVLFLGDNIYPAGLPDEKSRAYEAKRRILQSQADLVKGSLSKGFFIPGNHDWKNSKEDGLEQVRRQGRYLQSLQLNNVFFLPEGGCPGPVEVSLSEEVVLVIMDTQWWLHTGDKPGPESDCECKTSDDVLISLKDIAYRNRNRLLLFASHHPFKTYGKHGGYFTLKQHLFPLTELHSSLWLPLPVIGSVYPLARALLGGEQDTRHPVYKRMIRSVEEVLNAHPHVIHIAGHDHNLQLIQDSAGTYVVSGAGSNAGPAKKSRWSPFAASETGFSVLELLKDGRVWIKFYSTEDGHPGSLLFAGALEPMQKIKPDEAPATAVNLPDSITINGAFHYKTGKLRQFFLGKNYRREWMQPVRMAVLDLAKEAGGLKPVQRGGGKQSKTLRLEAPGGRQYVLRSVEKFPGMALPEEFRETFAESLVKDGISASYPYAGLSIPPLARAVGVPHVSPRLVYVPDDPRLGIYRTDFANMTCILEEREPEGLNKTISTEKLFEKLAEDNDRRVDELAVLKARLLDIFIMDFDRHEDQWRWGSRESKKTTSYFPIPRDRDQAFFINNGLLPRFASRPWLLPQLQGMRVHSRNIRGFNFPARNFDRAFLTGLTAEDWKREAGILVDRLSDSVIEAALKAQPGPVFNSSGRKIIDILKERRNFLVGEALQYYRFLAREVTVTGSDKKEWFDVTRHEDGAVSVIVYATDGEGKKEGRIFERRFLPGETKEIRLFGLGGDDRFSINGSTDRTITIRLIGGSGNEIYENTVSGARAKTVVYDLKTEENRFEGDQDVRKKLSADPAVNEFDRKAFRYDILQPALSVNYNNDDGLYLGVSLKYTGQGFRKDPYKTMHQLSVNHALATRAYNFGYKAEWIDVVGKADLVFNSSIKAPNYTTNFFRYGNETDYTRGKTPGIRFYRARFDVADLALLARGNLSRSIALAAGPTFQYFNMDRQENKNRLISFPSLNGLDSAALYERKTYAGIQFVASVDRRDNKLMPARGINWQTSFRLNKGLNGYANNYSQLNTDLSFFMSFQTPARLVVATRLGGGINFGRYEFFQAQYLSGTENLRGFRKYRFAGDKMLFSNTELRLKLADLNTYFFPGSLGILGFYDVGRVWVKHEPSNKWHKGYGGGLWVAPLKKFVIAACYTASEEGGLPLVSFGFQF